MVEEDESTVDLWPSVDRRIVFFAVLRRCNKDGSVVFDCVALPLLFFKLFLRFFF